MSAASPTIHSLFHRISEQATHLLWQEIPLADDIGQIAARVGEDTVTMTSRAWSSERFRLVRETLMESERKIQVFNLVAYPRTEFDAPVFATDVVVIGGKLRIGVADAIPLFPDEPAYRAQWVEPFLPLEARARELAPRFALKMEWSRHYLGEAACLATGLPLGGDWPCAGPLRGLLGAISYAVRGVQSHRERTPD